MKEVHVPATRLECRDMQGALDTVFGPAMLKRVHGPDTEVCDFDRDGNRTFKFSVDVCRVPWAIRHVFCGSHLRITTRQTLTKPSATRWQVSNDTRMHFLGSELFKLKPVFSLVMDGSAVHVGGNVQHIAHIPPPFNRIAETFMAKHTERELRKFGACLQDDHSVRP